MGAKSRIEWTDATWNPLRARRGDGKVGWHCEHVSEACRNCYAERLNRRGLAVGTGLRYVHQARASITPFVDQDTLLQPLRWKRPRRIFVCSMTDLFGEWHTDDDIERVFAVMALCPQHTFQVLTKRPARMAAHFENLHFRTEMVGIEAEQISGLDRFLPDDYRQPRWTLPLPNVWLGVTAEDQATADERIPLLLRTPAAKRFVSAEPLLGPLDLRNYLRMPWMPDRIVRPGSVPVEYMPVVGLDWVITGGESGLGARPSHPDWFRSLRDQCVDASVPFFFKQWGSWQNGSDEEWQGKIVLNDGRRGETPESFDLATREHWPEFRPCYMSFVGKARAGRMLDGREWSRFPGGARV